MAIGNRYALCETNFQGRVQVPRTVLPRLRVRGSTSDEGLVETAAQVQRQRGGETRSERQQHSIPS